MDLRMTVDGELVIGPNGDYDTVTGDEELAQRALFVLKTTAGDWLLEPGLGASLERFIGASLTKETLYLMEETVTTSLIETAGIPDPVVMCLDTGDDTVMVLVEFSSVEEDDRRVQLRAALDMRKGKVLARYDFRQT